MKFMTTALITGASRGIGKETALVLAENGYDLILTYIYEDEAKEVKAECEKHGVNVQIFKFDITKEQYIEELSQKIDSIDVLINNAGVASGKPLNRQSYEDIDNQITTNLLGLIKFTKAMIDKVQKVLINMGSVGGKKGIANSSVYCATKFGVRGFTQSLIEEYPNLKIYSVNPGLTKTHMTHFQGVEPREVAEIIFRTIKRRIQNCRY